MSEADFVQHFLKHKSELEAMLTALTGDSHVADDLFQESVVIMLEKRGEINAERAARMGRCRRCSDLC